jgi:hypothetical protein
MTLHHVEAFEESMEGARKAKVDDIERFTPIIRQRVGSKMGSKPCVYVYDGFVTQ